MMPPELPPFQLHEPEDIESLLPGWWLPHILIVSTLLVALVFVAVLLVRAKNRPRPVDYAKIREEARLKAITTLESSRSSITTPREAAVLASLALRAYLSRAADDPALFETHEEFIARRDSLSALLESARMATAAGFSHLATLKYAADPPHATATGVLESARTLLEEIHSGFAKT